MKIWLFLYQYVYLLVTTYPFVHIMLGAKHTDDYLLNNIGWYIFTLTIHPFITCVITGMISGVSLYAAKRMSRLRLIWDCHAIFYWTAVMGVIGFTLALAPAFWTWCKYHNMSISKFIIAVSLVAFCCGLPLLFLPIFITAGRLQRTYTTIPAV